MEFLRKSLTARKTPGYDSVSCNTKNPLAFNNRSNIVSSAKAFYLISFVNA